MGSNFLVTGGAGFIGSFLCRSLIADGHSVIVIDNLSTGDVKNVPKAAQFIQGSCENEGDLMRLKDKKFEAIFHLAGQSSGEISFDNPILDMDANVKSTLVLLKYAKETGCKKFIYASSMSVYGDPISLPVHEEMETKPKSFYAVGKLASENYLRIYNQFEIKTVILRLFNVYGEGQNLNNLRQGMASIYLAQALKSGKILVKGTSNRFRDFIHVDDVVAAFRKAEDESIPSGVYNVCRGEKVTVDEILTIINNNICKPAEIYFAPGTPGDQFGIYGSTDHFEKVFGLKSEISFIQGMKSMVKWAETKFK
jgi:UDP-glucose 4-epimerase